MIGRMTTAPPQQRYDHRLRELVQRTGNLTIATDRGVPESTARGWLRTAPTVVVGLDVANLNELELPTRTIFGVSSEFLDTTPSTEAVGESSAAPPDRHSRPCCVSGICRPALRSRVTFRHLPTR